MAERILTEDEEQTFLFRWADYMESIYPELHWMYACPNGGQRAITTAKRLKATGVKAGVPDIYLPAVRLPYHGLYIEMKRTKRGVLSDNQKKWIAGLTGLGYYCAVCKGWQEASELILRYLEGDLKNERGKSESR